MNACKEKGELSYFFFLFPFFFLQGMLSDNFNHVPLFPCHSKLKAHLTTTEEFPLCGRILVTKNLVLLLERALNQRFKRIIILVPTYIYTIFFEKKIIKKKIGAK